MRIGIDLDEVLVEWARGYLKTYNENYKKNILFSDLFSYNLWEPLNITKEEALNLEKEFYNSELFENIEFVKEAKEALIELVKNNELFIITSRPHSIRRKTHNFFKKHFSNLPLKIFHSNDFFGLKGKSKADLCKKLGISVLIEDNKNYALGCAKKDIRIFLLNKPWNKDCEEHRNIMKVNNWKEILQMLK